MRIFAILALIFGVLAVPAMATADDLQTVYQTPYAFAQDSTCNAQGYVQVNHAKGVFYKIDGKRVRQDRAKYTRVYFDSAQVTVTAHPRPGWKFSSPKIVTRWELQVRPKPIDC